MTVYNCSTLPSRIPAQSDCNTAVNGNAGCGAQVNTAVSYGPSFNDNGGGWFVVCWVGRAGVHANMSLYQVCGGENGLLH